MTQPAAAETMEPQLSRLSEGVTNSLNNIFHLVSDAEAWSPTLDWGERLRNEGTLSTKALIKAFKTIRRYDFLPPEIQAENFRDKPLPIGENQTISQPSLVGGMLESLDLRRGGRVLDMGSGSGWTTALMGAVTGQQGEVIGTERVPALVEMGRANLGRYNMPWVHIEQSEDELGRAQDGPYDRILVSGHLRESWLEQLAEQLRPDGGVMIAPVVAEENYGQSRYDQELVRVERQDEELSKVVLLKQVGFVPIVLGEAVQVA